MKIFGDFEVTSTDRQGNKRFITKGKNTFCDVGKQHVCDWLMHDNYSEDSLWDGANPLSGGRSLGDVKIVPYTDVQVYRQGTHSYIENEDYCMYPHNSSMNYCRLAGYNTTWDEGTYNPIYGTLYWEFSELKKIKGMIVWGYRETWNRGPMVDISTSPNTFAEDTNWTRQNFKFLTNDWTNDSPAHTKDICVWKWDYYNQPGRPLDGVRTLRLRTRYNYTTLYRLRLYGVWFLEDNSYPNTPSVIALGDGSATPLESDTALASEKLRKFVRLHKDTGNDYQVKFSTRIDFDEGNSDTFREIGLFFHETAGDYLGGDHQASYCQKLFSRGLFDTPWTKTSSEQVDVDYILTITD